MCYSATVSFVAAGAIGVVGVATVKKVRSKSDLPMASIPLLFAAQQLTEGVLWLSFNSPKLLTAMTYLYSLFSHVLWPFFIPLSVLLIEKNPFRRKILSMFLIVGAILSSYLLYFIIAFPVTAQITNRSIQYNYHHHFSLWVLAVYVVVIAISLLFSSSKIINLLGALIGASFLVTVWAYTATFFSVWCFFAAILSVIIYWYFWNRQKT